MHSFIFYIFLVWLSCLSDLTVMCYKIPEVKLEVLQNGFRVSIPHEAGITSVIYNIEINEQCPLIYDLITAQRGNFWISEQNAKKLYVNDEIKINVVVQHNDGIFARTDIIDILQNFQLTFKTVKNGDQPVDACDFDAWNENAANVDNIDKRSITKVTLKNQQSSKSYEPNKLIFEENFNTLDNSIWSYDLYMHSNAIGDRSEEFTMFTNHEDHISVQNGSLLITPSISTRRQNETFDITGCNAPACYKNRTETCIYKKQKRRFYMYPPPVDSAKINTANAFSFTYGRIEVSAKLPEGDWLIPYIMLQPDQLNCNMRKQLRIAYATSKDLEKFRIRGGPVIVYGVPNPTKPTVHIFERTSHMSFQTGVNPNEYHNYTMVWTSNQIAMFVDGKKYGCIANNGEYTERYHIVLGVSAGGHLEYTQTTSQPWSNGRDSAVQQFHESFTQCCSRHVRDGVCTQEVCKRKQKGKKYCTEEEKSYVKRICSKPWGPQATMAINYVRVYAV
ncbi:gram-negative bacteria-binding protein 2-like isoform X1 [Anastrepha ludens]|uniref:gram-negative bacteria-binding protein 2-like isoform X1 n=1 Tax=Anastrepha ludens TaxID=28586 RepID=UPI0023B0F3B4|nr:gram-negative bacteria-binding protein 2-like isoform X1 [Anastrepha ludens]